MHTIVALLLQHYCCIITACIYCMILLLHQLHIALYFIAMSMHYIDLQDSFVLHSTLQSTFAFNIAFNIVGHVNIMALYITLSHDSQLVEQYFMLLYIALRSDNTTNDKQLHCLLFQASMLQCSEHLGYVETLLALLPRVRGCIHSNIQFHLKHSAVYCVV